MKVKVAILTGDRDYGQRLRTMLGPQFEHPISIVRDESDFAFGALGRSDLILLGSDLTRQRIPVVLRALAMLRPQIRTIALIRSKEGLDRTFEFLCDGLWAIVLDEECEHDIKTAALQVLLDRRFLSPQLLCPIIKRYRELCSEVRREYGRLSSGPVLHVR